jgi:hypothetical protein
MEQIELEAELTEAEELRQAFDTLTLIANRQVEMIRALRIEIECLKGIIHDQNTNW